MPVEIKVPDIGDFDAVEIIEVLVAVGDELAADSPLIVMESDKATMEIPCPQAGKLLSVLVKVGDKVAQGDLIGSLEPQEVDSQVQPEPTQVPEAIPEEIESAKPTEPPSIPQKVERPASQGTASKTGLAHASPSVRMFARELGVDLNLLEGSGPKQRILKTDVQSFVKQQLSDGSARAPGRDANAALPQMPTIDFSKFGEVESKALARIRKLSAQNLHRNWLVVPHVTQFESADITDLESFRKAESSRTGVKLTLLPFLVKAVSLGLKTYPDFNASLASDGESLILKKYFNVGFAADTPNGLVVPVIRDVPSKSVSELAIEAGELAATARDGKLSPAQMQGGCFSISSLGGIGGSHFTPIVNAPEVAILGVSRAKTEAVWDGEQFKPRLMLPLSLSYDHRVIDGAAAARFAVYLAELLSDIRRLLL